MKLLDNKKLERTSVVANCAMNRERQAFGDNSYEKELQLNLLGFLKARAEKEEGLRWLDLCCGRGRALVQAARALQEEQSLHKFHITGVDLGGMFAPLPEELAGVELIHASLEEYTPHGPYDLVTSVHGLHYVGDKLGVICRYVRYLKEDGLFLAHVDPYDILDQDGRRLDRAVLEWFKKAGFQYDPKTKLLACEGAREVDHPFEYSGADDKYGKNYTGQETVGSYYDA